MHEREVWTDLIPVILIDLQRSQLKLSIITTRQRSGEGYVFSRVSVRPWEAGGESCGAVHALPDMFKLGLGLRCTGTPPVPDMFKKFVHYVAHTVGKAGGRLAFDWNAFLFTWTLRFLFKSHSVQWSRVNSVGQFFLGSLSDAVSLTNVQSFVRLENSSLQKLFTHCQSLGPGYWKI